MKFSQLKFEDFKNKIRSALMCNRVLGRNMSYGDKVFDLIDSLVAELYVNYGKVWRISAKTLAIENLAIIFAVDNYRENISNSNILFTFG